MKFLISGTKSGLGKHLFEIFGGISLTRETSKAEIDNLKKGVDIIIHAAFNSNKDIDSNNIYSYLADNIFLTEKLIKIPHKKFIFISSVDVYPKDNIYHKEDEVININTVEGIYGLTKLMSESLVKRLSPNFLILRCSALLGKYARKNTLIKIRTEEKPIVALSSDSSLNYILHTDVSEFIKLAIEKNLQGVYNLASSKNITLKQVADLVKKKVTFGSHIYSVGNIDNKKATLVTPSFEKTSEEEVRQFLKQVSL